MCVRKVCGYGTTEASTCCSEGGTHMRFHEMIMMKDERGGRTRRKTVGGVLDVKALTCVYVCVCVCVCVCENDVACACEGRSSAKGSLEASRIRRRYEQQQQQLVRVSSRETV